MEVSTRSRSPDEIGQLWAYLKGRLSRSAATARNAPGAGKTSPGSPRLALLSEAGQET
jgi:hypothetical protein